MVLNSPNRGKPKMVLNVAQRGRDLFFLQVRLNIAENLILGFF